MILKTAQDEIQNYLHDTSGIKSSNTEGVYFPDTTKDIIEIIKKANQENFKVTVAGNGTGTTGGRIAPSGFVIATDKLNKIYSFQTDDIHGSYISADAGVLLKSLQQEAETHGFIYPPDPTERNAFIGGTISTNASGARTFKYGSTRDWVQAIEVVLPLGDTLYIERGKIFETNGFLEFSSNERDYKLPIPTYQMPPIKHAAGYFSKKGMDLIDLFIGSEGTLGIITSAKLRLTKKPQKMFSGILFFPTESAILKFVDSAIQLSTDNREKIDQPSASSIEFFDEQSLHFLCEKYPQTPKSAKGAIYFEQECTEKNEDSLLEFWYNFSIEHDALIDESWFAQTQKDDEFFKEYRHALPSLINEFLSRHQMKKISSDIAVPKSYFPNMMKLYHQYLDPSSFKWVIFGHIGNYHLHMNILPHNESEFSRGKDIYNIFISEAIKMGGTISAEHGVGKIKTDYLEQMLGKEGLQDMVKIKKILDPNSILGFGTLIPGKYLN